MPILQIRDKDGKFIPIPAIKGDNGKSAYEQAKEGGFQGTEQEFIQLLSALSTSMQLQLLELGDEQSYLEEHVANKSNPHGVTAQQVGSLKVYYSFATLNKELGKAFDVTTPIETIIKAMPDNTGFIGDVNSYGKEVQIYPAVYGILSIYKIRENRVMVEYVSNIANGVEGYNRRWVGQYNAGAFGGFKEVFTEAHPPTAEQVGALSKTPIVGKNVLEITKDGWYYSTDTKNVPTETKNGYVRVMTNTNGDYRVVTWHPRDSVKEYTNVLFEGQWLGWSEHIIRNNNRVNIYTDDPAISPQVAIGRDYRNCAGIMHTENDTADIRCHKDGKIDTLSLGNLDVVGLQRILCLWTRNGTAYPIFGEHNKPVGSYTGNGSTERHITTGGIGNALILWSTDNYDFGALIIPSGAMFFRGGTLQTTGKSVCYFENGSLHIYGNYITLNETNKTYNYQVL